MIPCPICGGSGSTLEERWTEDDFSDLFYCEEPCEECGGTGQVLAPAPPVRKKQYEIVNAGMVDGRYRVWARDKYSPDNRLFTADTEQGAVDRATAWANARLSDFLQL